MTHPQNPKQTVRKALETAGFVRLPPLWVSREDFDIILRVAERHGPAVNAIRAKINPKTNIEGMLE